MRLVYRGKSADKFSKGCWGRGGAGGAIVNFEAFSEFPFAGTPVISLDGFLSIILDTGVHTYRSH